ncbi:MAG: glycosyltransferase [Clostridia bacterium]|nr:glycosyltransferase [Clostridia bacterium]
MKALLVTLDKYPDIDAGAVRTHMFAKMLMELGYSVQVISMGASTQYHSIEETDGVEHMSFRGLSNGKLMKATYYVLFPIRLWAHLKNHEYSVIIHSQVDEISLRVIQEYGIRKGIPTIYDSVEWFSPLQFQQGEKARAYRRNNRYNTTLIKRPSSVIAISKYLEKHFKDKGIKTARIPVVMDAKSFDVVKETTTDYITLLYAGSPGKKDYLENVINAISLMDVEKQKRIRFIVLGVTKDQLVTMCGVKREVLDKVAPVLEVKGRVPREEVLTAYNRADFSVLIRPSDQRYAMAGFPTKFVESLCCSTPMICNITSDLDEYCENRGNSIVLDSIDPKEIVKVLNEVVEMEPEKLTEMKDCARKTAEMKFDYRIYTNILDGLIAD